MPEFTLRNKAKSPILSLSKLMLSKALAARPESVALMLGKYMQDYLRLTGKSVTLDYEQQLLLLRHADADEHGTWSSKYSDIPLLCYKVMKCFEDGLLGSPTSASLTDTLAQAECFFDALDLLLRPSSAGGNG